MCLYTFYNVKIQKYSKIKKLHMHNIKKYLFIFISYFFYTFCKFYYKKYKYIIYGRVF